MSLGTNIKSYFQSNNNNNNEVENTITNILKRHTIGQKYHLSEYLQKYDAINRLSEYLKNYSKYNNKSTQYTLIGVGKSYYDFLIINQNKETAVIRISDTETSYYYLEKTIQNNITSILGIEEIKPDGLITRIKSCKAISNISDYKDNIDNFRQKIYSVNNSITNLRKKKVYKFTQESLYNSVLRYILTIIRANNKSLNDFLIYQLKIPFEAIENCIKKEIYNLSIEDIFNITEYSEYFTVNALEIIQQWFEKEFVNLKNYYEKTGDTFVKRNIDYNNLFITNDFIELVDYSKTRIGFYLIDLADYLSIAKSSAFDLSSIYLEDSLSEDYQFNFEDSEDSADQINNTNNNAKNKKTQNNQKYTVSKDEENLIKKEINILVVLSTLKNAAINICNTNNQTQKEFKNKFIHIQTLNQFRDMLNTRYTNNPETLFALNNISIKEYISIVNKQCTLCLNDCESF